MPATRRILSGLNVQKPDIPPTTVATGTLCPGRALAPSRYHALHPQQCSDYHPWFSVPHSLSLNHLPGVDTVAS